MAEKEPVKKEYPGPYMFEPVLIEKERSVMSSKRILTAVSMHSLVTSWQEYRKRAKNRRQLRQKLSGPISRF